jgi:hypothetical protein
MASSCILWQSAAFQGTRCIPGYSVAFQGTQLYSGTFQGTRLHSQGLKFDSDRLSIEDPYESRNRQGRLMPRIAEYTKTPSETNATGNSSFIVFSILISKTTIFTYEIKHHDPLIETLLLSITRDTIFSIHYTKNVANYSALSTTFYNGFRF